MIWLDEDRVLHFDRGRCCQCGACLAACSEGALYRLPFADGRFDIAWHADKCTSCGRCAYVCPAPVLPERPWTKDSWENIDSCWTGHARDEKIRRNSSSGGVVRTLLASVLSLGKADEAYCLVEKDAPPGVEGGYLSAGFPVSSPANSTYRPVPFLERLEFARLRGGKLAIAGTNCQLMAAGRFFEGSETGLLRIGILCKQQKHLGFTSFIRRRLGFPPEGGEKVSYRGDGWPGTMSIGGIGMDWADAAALPFGKGLWTLPACRFCPNAMGDGADITVADPWNIVSGNQAGAGLSLVIVHTRAGRDLIDSSSGMIHFEPVGVELAKSSVDWPSLVRKLKDVTARTAPGAPFTSRAGIMLRDSARKVLERLLDRRTPPRFALRLLAKLPISPW